GSAARIPRLAEHARDLDGDVRLAARVAPALVHGTEQGLERVEEAGRIATPALDVDERRGRIEVVGVELEGAAIERLGAGGGTAPAEPRQPAQRLALPPGV